MAITNAALRADSSIVALSDAMGRYQFRVPPGWSGRVTAEKTGWAITPASRSYTNLTENVSGQDFTGTPDLPVLSTSLSNGVPLLSWTAQTGQTYRVEVSRDLAKWDVLGEPVRLESNPAVRAVELEGYSHWFARLAQPAREYQMQTGQVELPPGSGLDLASLQVLGGQNTSGVMADGGFPVFQPGSGPALVALMASNQPVLLGYVGGPGGGVSAQSTANWLLFQAVGGCQLPPSTWSQVLGLIDASPEAHALAEVISQCVAANPLALVQGEPTISNALWVAAETLVRTNGSPVPPGRLRKDDPEDLQAGSFVIEGPYPAQQTGLRCEHNLEGAGLVLVNDYRRHLKYFVYRVGYEDQQGVTHELPASDWERVKEINDYLPGVNGVEGVLSSLVGVMLGQVAYGPSVSSEIRLTVQPEEAKKVFYRVVVTGPGMEVYVPDELRTHPLRPQWEEAYGQMQRLEFVKEYVVPWLFAAVPADAVGELGGVNAEAAYSFVEEASGTVLDLKTTIGANDYAAAGQSLLYALVNDAGLREDVLDVARKYGWVTVGEAGVAELAKLMPSLLSGLGIVDRLIRQMDLALVSDHILRSYPLVYWDVTVLPPRVEMEASDRAANRDEPVSLTATVTPMPDLTNSFVKFHWTTSGQGKLRHQAGAIVKEGTDFEVVVTNGSCTVSYQNRSNATHGATESVRVAVKRVDISAEGVREVLVGEATNEVFVINVAAVLKPAETNLLIGEQALLTLKLDPVVPKGLSNLVYTWTLDGSSGSLSGANDLQRTYRAAAHGWDVVKVAVKGDYGGKTYALAETQADLKVVPVRVTLKPSGPIMGLDRVLTLTAKVEPEPAEGQVVYRWQNVGPAGELIGGNDQQTSWPTNQFHSSATVEGTNRITVTAYLVTATETNEVAQAKTDVVVRSSLSGEAPGQILRLVSGDWNQDGFPDLAALVQARVDQPESSGVAVLLNQAERGFTNTAFLRAEPLPDKLGDGDLVTVEWNGDGLADLAWMYGLQTYNPERYGNAWQVMVGDGSGQFTVTNMQYADGLSASTAGDIDSDGRDDLLSCVSRIEVEEIGQPGGTDTHLCQVWEGVRVWKNTGTAGLPTPGFAGWTFGGTNLANPISRWWRVEVADLNGDHSQDVVFNVSSLSQLGYPTRPDGTYALLNDGHGEFPGLPVIVVSGDMASACRDFNGDGASDLWMGFDSVSQTLRFLLNDGSGSFAAPKVVSVPMPLEMVAAATNTATFPGTTIPCPFPPEWFTTSIEPADLTDINNDGHPDFLFRGKVMVAAGNFNMAWRHWTFLLVNDGQGGFQVTSVSENALWSTHLGPLLDVDRDGDLDLIHFEGNYIGAALNPGDGTF